MRESASTGMAPAVIEGDAHPFEAEPLDIRTAAGRHQHAIDVELLAVVQGRADRGSGALQPFDGAAEAQIHALRIGLAERPRDLGIEAAQQGLAAMEQGGLGAEPGETPANSTAMYPPPTTRMRSGWVSSSKTPFESMASSAPGISGSWIGRAPPRSG